MVLFLLFILIILIGAASYLFVFRKKRDLSLQKTVKPGLPMRPPAPPTPPIPPAIPPHNNPPLT